MGRVHTEIVQDAHAYTRSAVPWAITTPQTAHGKLMNYISGGGMRIFGRTVRQEERERRQLRFLAVSAALSVVWLFLLIF